MSERQWISDEVDWSFPFEENGWDQKGCTNPEHVRACKDRLRKLAENPTGYEATTDGGWPRVGWGQVLGVGMASMWPYWRPRPAVILASRMFGATWEDWLSITDIAPLKQETSANG